MDLEHLESLIDDATVAMVVTNPSNPCGSAYSEEHMRAIIAGPRRCPSCRGCFPPPAPWFPLPCTHAMVGAVAAKRKVPIISDEVYSGMVFSSAKFFPVAPLASDVRLRGFGRVGLRSWGDIPRARLRWCMCGGWFFSGRCPC